MNLNLYHLILRFIKKDERTICTRADLRYIKANYFKKIHVDIILHGGTCCWRYCPCLFCMFDEKKNIVKSFYKL